MTTTLTRLLWRRRGVAIPRGAFIRNARGLNLAHGVALDSGVTLVGHEVNRHALSIGRNTVVRANSYISARRGRVAIGAFANLGHGSWVGGQGEIVIGEWLLCGPHVVIISSNHDFRGPLPYATTTEEAGRITIGASVWLGANSTVLAGSSIGDGAVIAAGSVVRGEIPEFAIAAGNPAVVVGVASDSKPHPASSAPQAG